MSPKRPPTITAIPDSADARLLVELTSHATDVTEASHALGLALDAGEASELWLPLTMHAVTAYSRPFAESKVRDRLDAMKQFSGIPAELQCAHDMVRKYRNTTVAHSQSDLVMPIALAILDDRGAVRDVVGVTLVHPMPLVVAEQFAELLSVVEALIEVATRPVVDRLRRQLSAVAPAVVAEWPMPERIDATDVDFSGANARTRQPRVTMYWGAGTPTSAEG